MKKALKKTTVLILSIFVFATCTFAKTYYVDATGGSDINNGTTISTAWKTISKVNSSPLVAGDNVLFKRGEIFRGNLLPKSGSASGYITFGAYSAGNKPKLLGSYNASTASQWTNTDGNIWSTVVPSTAFIPATHFLPNDVGNIVFNNEASCGIKKLSLQEITSQGYFYCNSNTRTVYIYSTANPATIYSNIELVLDRHMIDVANKSYCIFENLDIRYAGAHGISGGNSHHIWIRDVDFSFIGGGILSGTTRYGNGVEFWESTHDNIVERCTLSEIYDAALTAQGINAATVYNLYFRNNIIDKCEYSWEFFEYSAQSNIHEIYFENNTCLNAGMGWGHSQRPDPDFGSHVQLWGNLAGQSANLMIRNNIFHNSIRYGLYVGNGIDKYTIDYNSWSTSGTMTMRNGNNNYNVSTQWSAYKSATGKDANSINSNPLLNADNSLTGASPCIDAGLTLTSVTSDFNNLARPQGLKFDIGAFEFLSTGLGEIKQLQFHLSPVPASNFLRILTTFSPIKNKKLLVYDLKGGERFHQNLSSNDEVISVSSLPDGIYLLKMQTENNIEVNKFVVLH